MYHSFSLLQSNAFKNLIFHPFVIFIVGKTNIFIITTIPIRRPALSPWRCALSRHRYIYNSTTTLASNIRRWGPIQPLIPCPD